MEPKYKVGDIIKTKLDPEKWVPVKKVAFPMHIDTGEVSISYLIQEDPDIYVHEYMVIDFFTPVAD